MAMFNDLFQAFADVPPMLATAWAVWLVTGAALVVWFRRAKREAEFPAPAPAARPVSKPKAVTRSSSGPDMPATEPYSAETGATSRPKPAPVVVGDPFGDLATLLDQPAAAPAAAASTDPAPPAAPRGPADSPILSSSGSPIRRANNDDSTFVA
jgi:hypothetical protein